MKLSTSNIHYLLYFLIAAASISCVPTETRGDDKLVFIVQRNDLPRKTNEKVSILLDWNTVTSRLPATKNYGFIVSEMNFEKGVSVQLIDANNDNKPDNVLLDFTFTSNEPIYTFYLQPSSQKVTLSKNAVKQTEGLQVTYLSSSTDHIKAGQAIAHWPDKIIESTMQFYPEPSMITLYAPDQWNYEYGFFLNATFVQWQRTKKDSYFQYIKKWADRFINDQGQMDTAQYNVSEYRLDDILPGRLFISLYEVTKEEKYQKAAAQLRDHLRKQPKTSDGGYWHKQIYPHQMWLDGIYMGDIFATHFATVFNEPALIDEAIHQIKLIAKHTTDPTTGLMYHGWDESKNKVWAHPEKGTSPEFWARAVGWYAMALVETLEYIPAIHPERKDVIALLQNLSKSLLRYQDKKSGLWFQVLDKGDKPGNWIETSGSAMFAYAFAKGHAKGYLDQSYLKSAQRAFDSLVKNYVYFDDAGKLYLDQTVKVGTLNMKFSKGDFDYYISTERRINDYKGLAALLYASIALDNK